MDKKVLAHFQAQCARREYCTSDIRHKVLKALGGSEVETDEIIESLVSEGYLCDLRYAVAFTREKSEIEGWGPVKISFALAAKGISKELIAGSADEVDKDRASDRLQRLLTNKIRTLKGDPQWKLKAIRYALGRGYHYDSVAEALSKLDIGKAGTDDQPL